MLYQIPLYQILLYHFPLHQIPLWQFPLYQYPCTQRNISLSVSILTARLLSCPCSRLGKCAMLQLTNCPGNVPFSLPAVSNNIYALITYVINILWLQPYVHIDTPSHSHTLHNSHSISDQIESNNFVAAILCI